MDSILPPLLAARKQEADSHILVFELQIRDTMKIVLRGIYSGKGGGYYQECSEAAGTGILAALSRIR